MTINICYAVEIACNFSGEPFASTTYGLTADGYFRWITGRPGYAGVPTYPHWEDGSVNEEVWYEDILQDNALSNPSRRIDISVSGQYGTLSGINIDVLNYNKIFEFIQTNEIRIIGRNVRVFAVIDGTFYQIWNGIVQNLPYDESSYTIECKDSYKQIHKVMPKNIIGVAEYTESEDQGEVIPIVIGDVAYAKLIDVGEKPFYVDLCATDYGYYSDPRLIDRNRVHRIEVPSENYKYKIAALALYEGNYGYTTTYVTLLTNKVSIAKDELSGYYLIGKKGNGIDTEYASLIMFNDATGPGGTRLYVAGDMQGITHADMSNHYYNATKPENADTWWYSVAKLDNDLIVSESQITSFIKDKWGNYQIFTFDKETNVFKQVSSLIKFEDLTGGTIGYPGLKVITKKRTIDGDIEYSYGISPVQFRVTNHTINNVAQNELFYKNTTGSEVGPYGVISSDKTNALLDKNVNSYIVARNTLKLIDTIKINIDIILPQESLDDNFSDLYIGLDCLFDWGSEVVEPAKAFSKFVVSYYDVYDRLIKTSTTNFKYPPNNTDTEHDYKILPFDVRQLPESFYQGGTAWSYVDYTTDKNFWGRTDEYLAGDPAKINFEVYNEKIKIDDTMLADIKEGLASNRINIEVQVNCDPNQSNRHTDIYVYQVGLIGRRILDVISNDLYAKVSGFSGFTGMQSSVYTTYKNILENYDEYGVGLTGGNGPIDWIDYGNLPTTRSDWAVGRQITEQKNSYEFLNELSQQSFVGMFPARRGNRKLVAWRDLEEYTTTLGETGIIRDSIRDFKKTEASQVFNDFKCEYSYNSAVKKFDRALLVTHTDEASFPEYTDESWKTYVQGLSSTSYADAKVLWDIAHNAYDVTYTITKNPSVTQKLNWYYDRSIFDNTEFFGASIDDAAYRFLQNLVVWGGLRKDICKLRIPITTDNVKLELLDMIKFSDSFYTDGIERKAWITLIEVDTKKHQITLEITMEPLELMDDDVIIERGIPLNVDIIEESGSQPDIIIES